MSLKIVGAGLGRTGTYSLKLALERLLGEPCYHMAEVFERPQDIPVWRDAALGKEVDWQGLMQGFGAAVDWPASAFWRELSDAFPSAKILVSTRDPEKWWISASATIFSKFPRPDTEERRAWLEMIQAVLGNRFTNQIDNKEACIEAYKRHYEEVFATAPKERLIVWQATDGWAPICDALNLPIPEEPFPKANTTEEFNSRFVRQEADESSS